MRPRLRVTRRREGGRAGRARAPHHAVERRRLRGRRRASSPRSPARSPRPCRDPPRPRRDRSVARAGARARPGRAHAHVDRPVHARRVRRRGRAASPARSASVAVGVFAFTLFVVGIVWPIVDARRASTSRSRRRPTRPSATTSALRITVHGPRGAGRGARARPDRAAGGAPRRPTERHHPARRDPARRLRPRSRADPHVGAARRLRPHAPGARRAARRRSRSRPRPRAAPRHRCARSRHARRARPPEHVVTAPAPTSCARCARTSPATRPGSCTGRRARGAARSSCASTSRRPTVGVALVVDLSGPPDSRRRRREPRRGHRRRSVLARRRGAGARHARDRRSGLRRGRRPRATSGAGSPRAVGGPPAPAPDGLAGRMSYARSKSTARLRAMTCRRRRRRAARRAWVAVATGRRCERGRARRGRRGRRAAARASRCSLGAVAGALPRRARACSRCRRSRPARATVSCCSASPVSARCGTRRSPTHRQHAPRAAGPRATLVALVLVDRADAETHPAARRAARRSRRALAEALRGRRDRSRSIVAVAAVALVPTVTDQLGRHVWPGVAAVARRRDSTRRRRCARRDELDMTSRPRLSDRVVFTVDAPRADFWRGEIVRRLGRSDVDALEPTTVAPLPRTAATRSRTSSIPTTPARPTAQPMRQTFHIETGFSERAVRGAERRCESRPTSCSSVAPTAPPRSSAASARTRSTRSTSRSCAADRGRRCARADSRCRPGAIVRPVRGSRRSRHRPRAARSPRRSPRGAPTTYDKIRAIEALARRHTRSTRSTRRSRRAASTSSTTSCSTSRVGWCEQVASSLVVLARSVGHPGPARDRLRARRARRPLGPLRRARARRARVDRDLLPGRRLAGLRSDRVGAARGRRRRRAVRGSTRPRDHAVAARDRARSCSCWLVGRRRPTSLARVRRRARRRGGRGRSARSRRLERIGRRAGRARGAGGDAPRVRAALAAGSTTPARRPSATSSTASVLGRRRRSARPRRGRRGARRRRAHRQPRGATAEAATRRG